MRSMKRSPAVASVIPSAIPAERPIVRAGEKEGAGPVRACEGAAAVWGGQYRAAFLLRPAHGAGTPREYPIQRTDSTHWASVWASMLVSCVLAGIGTLPHTPTLPFTIDCAR